VAAAPAIVVGVFDHAQFRHARGSFATGAGHDVEVVNHNR
jgi:hypothetical protein